MLVIIKTKEEQEAIQKIDPEDETAWMGAEWVKKNGNDVFVWLDRSEMGFKNQYSTFPDFKFGYPDNLHKHANMALK